MMQADGNDADNDSPMVIKQLQAYQQAYRRQLDRCTPYTSYRWLSTAVLVALFMLRILMAQAWYIVTYALGIYLLNLFLSFLQPKFDPSLEMDTAENDVEEGAPGLPQSAKDSDDFRPFIRRLPEFKFWYSATKATVIATVATIFEFTDVPVFWPILLVYFIVLFSITMRRQIAHMKRYKYVPWDLAKARYGGSK